ncbi:MAG: NAD(P)H-binding protein [Myxococcota bacterium]
MILVTTPTGDIGARVLRHLLDGEAEVRVLTRRPGGLPADIVDRVDVVEGSHSDPKALDDALAGGVRGVFWLPPGSPGSPSARAAYVDFSRAFCDAVPSSSITHVVGVSALGRGWPKSAGLVTSSIEMDDLIGKTGAHYRALACASLMDNVLRQREAISAGAYYDPTPGELKLPHVAKSDVAAKASSLLLSLEWAGVVDVPMCGPEEISFNEMTVTMSEVLGWPVEFRELTMEAFEKTALSMGASPSMAQAYVEMMTAKNEGMDLMGLPADRSDTPTTFRQWCEEELLPAIEAAR